MVEKVEESILYTDLVDSSKCSRTNDAAFAQFRFLDQSQLGQVWFGFCGGHRLWGGKNRRRKNSPENHWNKYNEDSPRIHCYQNTNSCRSKMFRNPKMNLQTTYMKIWHARKNRQLIHPKMSVWLSTTIIYLGCVSLFWAKISWCFCPGRHFLAKITAFPLKGQSQRSR